MFTLFSILKLFSLFVLFSRRIHIFAKTDQTLEIKEKSLRLKQSPDIVAEGGERTHPPLLDRKIRDLSLESLELMKIGILLLPVLIGGTRLNSILARGIFLLFFMQSEYQGVSWASKILTR